VTSLEREGKAIERQAGRKNRGPSPFESFMDLTAADRKIKEVGFVNIAHK